jgi:hypothetical protein
MSIRNVPKEIKELLIGVSGDLGVDYDIVEDIYLHQFEFTSEMISRGERDNYDSFENILLKHLGTFIANKKHINKLKDIHDRQVLQGE